MRNEEGAFARLTALGPWWRKGDLLPPLRWEEGERRGWAAPGYETFSLAAIPWEELRKGPCGPWRQVKKSSARRVAALRVEPPEGAGGAPGETLFVKWVQIRGWAKALGGALRPGKPAREFALARRLLARGIATPAPLLVAERREGFFLREAFLVTRGLDPPAWESARALWERLKIEGRAAEALELIRDLARALAEANRLGWVHADCRAQHWLLYRGAPSMDSEAPPPLARWAALDLDGGALGRPPSLWRRRRLLAMMAASFPRPLWSAGDTETLVKTYFRDQPMADMDLPAIQERAERLYQAGRKSRGAAPAAAASTQG